MVALGASAGGLEALGQFFENVPRDLGAAFVVVTHQHPGHLTMLPDLIGKHSIIPVELIEDGAEVAPNRVYVAPSSGPLTIEGGTLRVGKSERTQLPIDTFFRSLARDRGEDAIAIVLSGSGTDGTLGLAEIKALGGFAMAQDTGSARYAGMPASAADTRLIDCVLTPERMPAQIKRYLERPERDSSMEDTTAAINQVLQLLRSRTGHDFTAYKKSTLCRRIERRMNVHNVTSAREYGRLLMQTPGEVDVLFKELLIRVTNFFRDPEVFASLREQLRQRLLQRSEDVPFRVWVPACATGEEAYSIAMLLKELLHELGKNVPLQIFATDLDQQAIDFARAGLYPAGITADLSEGQLNQFFTKVDGSYRVNKEIREIIVFAAQNLIKDPPFTRLDLLSCRNFLIYLEGDLQRRVIALFGYALRPGGVLMLGSSETLSGMDDVFAAVDKKNKLFMREQTHADPPPGLPELPPSLPLPPLPRHRGATRATPVIGMLVDRILLAQFAPPSVLVNERGDVAYFHGRTGQFLEPASGEPTMNLFGMVREGLRLELPAALRQAASTKDPVVRSNLQVRNNGGFISVKLTVRRLEEPEPIRGLFLVNFQIEPPPEARKKTEGKGGAHVLERIAHLESELQHTRENLQGTIEELETSNEELKSTNEELHSTNEELQSVNEELETSREEMQSLNEELQTVNSELEERNQALSQANDDMQNLLNSTDIATVFLDDRLAIKRFTAQAVKVFRLIDSDIGRPISDLAANLRYDGLVSDAREVLSSLVFREREIQTNEGAWRLMRIMPYRTAENVIDGLVLTFVDIDRLKRDEQRAREAQNKVEALLDALPNGVLALNPDLTIAIANPAFYKAFLTSAKQAIGEPLASVADGVFDVPELLDRLRGVFEGTPTLSFELSTNQPHRLGPKRFCLRANRFGSQDSVFAVLAVEKIER